MERFSKQIKSNHGFFLIPPKKKQEINLERTVELYNCINHTYIFRTIPCIRLYNPHRYSYVFPTLYLSSLCPV